MVPGSVKPWCKNVTGSWLKNCLCCIRAALLPPLLPRPQESAAVLYHDSRVCLFAAVHCEGKTFWDFFCGHRSTAKVPGCGFPLLFPGWVLLLVYSKKIARFVAECYFNPVFPAMRLCGPPKLQSLSSLFHSFFFFFFGFQRADPEGRVLNVPLNNRVYLPKTTTKKKARLCWRSPGGWKKRAETLMVKY